MRDIIEYEPKRKRSNLPFWIAAFLGVLIFLVWSVNDNRRIQKEAAARAKAEKAEAADLRRDAAILRELEYIAGASADMARNAEMRRRRAYWGMKGEPYPGEPMPMAPPR